MLFLFQFITHPQYINITEGNDIALLQLDRPAIFNNFVSPICLPNGEQPAVGEICYATGYGRIGNFFFFSFCFVCIILYCLFHAYNFKKTFVIMSQNRAD